MATHFSNSLIQWYKDKKRPLPWRETSDPYKIWLSEIILQQTRVDQGMSYYLKFVEAFPRVENLAKAQESEVLRLWQGLGYYSRARNLHATAKYITEELHGIFPSTHETLLKLKGVGPYTAAAIASFAFGEAVPVVDGNVYRVLARYFGEETDIASSKAYKIYASISEEHILKEDPATYNQAIMEFGSLQCTPGTPDCPSCPLITTCEGYAQKKHTSLPIKTKKIKVKNRYFHYLVIEKDDRLMLNKRGPGDIWQGLYDFPLIEGPSFLDDAELWDEIQKVLPGVAPVKNLERSDTFKHVLSHQRLHAQFIKVTFQQPIGEHEALFHDLQAISELPKPVLINNYLKEFYF